jgi:hypothetical protein
MMASSTATMLDYAAVSAARGVALVVDDSDNGGNTQRVGARLGSPFDVILCAARFGVGARGVYGKA